MVGRGKTAPKPGVRPRKPVRKTTVEKTRANKTKVKAPAAKAVTPTAPRRSRTAPLASARKATGKRTRRKAAPPVRGYAPGPLIVDEATLASALDTLRARDPEVVARMIELAGPPPLRAREPGFAGLAWIVASQQVSVASANAIHGRLAAYLDPFEPAGLLAAPEAELKGCGLSAPKLRTLRAIAAAIVEGRLDFAALAAMDATTAHETLVAVHGIGPWTADIFLLFCLGHPDAWPAGDLALQEAARLALGLKQRPDAKKLEAIGERWRPCRGVAARLLWAYYKVARGTAGMALT